MASQLIPSSLQTKSLTYGVYEKQIFFGYCTGNAAIILDENLSLISLLKRTTKRQFREETQDDEDDFSIVTSIDNWKKKHEVQKAVSYKTYNQTVKIFTGFTTKEIYSNGKFAAKCLSFGPRAQLAVIFGNDVLIYLPTNQNRKIYWERTCCLRPDHEISCLSWEPWGKYLVIGGQRIQLWELGGINGERKRITASERLTGVSNSLNVVKWQSTLPSSLRNCYFSPFGKYIATVGENDRFIKVWYKYSPQTWQFIYLHHPFSIKSMVWRTKELLNPNAGKKLNVLLTVCFDNVIRLWMESPKNEPLQFSVCSIIEAGDGLVADFINNPFLDFPDLSIPEYHDFDEETSLTTQRHAVSVPERDKSIDWIVSTQNNGITIIWKVTGLADIPKHSSSCSLWCRCSAEPLKGKSENLICLSKTLLSTTAFPEIFELYDLKKSGSISLIQCVQESVINPRIIPTVKSTCTGHISDIKYINSHPTLDFVATLERKKNLLIWHLNDIPIGHHEKFLKQITFISGVTSFLWIEGYPLFLYKNESGINIGRIESQQFIHIGVLLNSVESRGQLFSKTENINDQKVLIIVAITSKGLLGWNCSLNKILKGGRFTDPIGEQFNFDTKGFLTLSGSQDFINIPKEGEFSFMTGSKSGLLKFWRINTKEGEIKFEKVTEYLVFPDNGESVSYLRTGKMGNILAGSKKAKKIMILHLTNSRLEIQHTFFNDYFSSLISVEWFTLDNGNQAIAVALENGVEIIIDKSSQSPEISGSIWVHINYQKYNDPVTSVGWLQSGGLIIGSEQQLFVYSKVNCLNDKTGILGPQFLPFSSLPVQFHKAYSCLPFYHPRILHSFLVADQYKKVSDILKYLLKILKETQEKEKKDVQIPLFPFEELLTEKEESSQQSITSTFSAPTNRYSFLRTTVQDSNVDKSVGSAIFSDTQEETFTTKDAEELSQILNTLSLPGVSSTAQMYLLAVIDTFDTMQKSRRSMDSCAIKYLLSFKVFTFLSKTSLTKDTNVNLLSLDWAWALHSETEDQLVSECLNENSTWKSAKHLGIAYWITNPTLLKSTIEQMAKAQFSKSEKDPWSCFLFYIALHKKPTIVQLFKAIGNKNVSDFLSHDFQEPKWKTGAQKNAYACMAKHRYEDAAGFFILGGDLKTGCTILLENFGDIQLAVCIARVMEGDMVGPISQWLFKEYIIPLAKKNNDNALESIAQWHLRKYSESVEALIHENSQDKDSQVFKKDTNSSGELFYFFKFLKQHTMLRNTQLKMDEIHNKLLKQSASTYLDSGNALTALILLKELIPKIKKDETKKDDQDNETKKNEEEKRKKKEEEEGKKEEEKQKDTAASLFGGGFGRPAANRTGFGRSFGGGFRMNTLFSASPVVEEKKEEKIEETVDNDLILKIALQIMIHYVENLSSEKFIPPPEKNLESDVSDIKNSTNANNLNDSTDINNSTDIKSSIDIKSSTDIKSSIDINNSTDIKSSIDIKGSTDIKSSIDIKSSTDINNSIDIKNSVDNLNSNDSADIKILNGTTPTNIKRSTDARDKIQEPFIATLFSKIQKLLLLNEKESLWIKKKIISFGVTQRCISAPLQLMIKEPHLQKAFFDQISKIICLTSQTDLSRLSSDHIDELIFLSGQFSLLLESKKVFISQEIRKKCITTLQIALFLSSLTSKQYKALSLIPKSPIQSLIEFDIPQDPEEIPLNYGKEETKEKFWGSVQIDKFVVDAETEKWLEIIIEIVCIEWFTNLNKGQEFEYVNLSLSQYTHQLESQILNLPEDFNENTKKTRLWLNTKSYLPLISKYVTESSFYLNSENFRNFWDSISSDTKLIYRISQIPFIRKLNEEKSESETVSFSSEPDIIFADKDIINSFCQNPISPNQYAIATTRNIREITIDFSHKQRRPVDSLKKLPKSVTPFPSPTQERISPTPKSLTPKYSPLRLRNLNSDFLSYEHLRFGKTNLHCDFEILNPTDRDFISVVLENHPKRPFYLSGGVDGSVRLWQFGAPKDSALLSTFKLEGPRISRIHFNSTGTKFGVVDLDGFLTLWRFGNQLSPFKKIHVHKICLDFAFLNSGSLLATAGIPFSDSSPSLSFWDTLLPDNENQIAHFEISEGGISSLIYSPRHQFLFAGCKKGEVWVIDVKEKKVLNNWHAHSLNIKSMSLNLSESFLMTGSNDGDVKVWSIPSFDKVEDWQNLHEKRTFYGTHGVFTDQISTFGVMQLSCNKSNLHSCGANGIIYRRNMK